MSDSFSKHRFFFRCLAHQLGNAQDSIWGFGFGGRAINCDELTLNLVYGPDFEICIQHLSNRTRLEESRGQVGPDTGPYSNKTKTIYLYIQFSFVPVRMVRAGCMDLRCTVVHRGTRCPQVRNKINSAATVAPRQRLSRIAEKPFVSPGVTWGTGGTGRDWGTGGTKGTGQDRAPRTRCRARSGARELRRTKDVRRSSSAHRHTAHGRSRPADTAHGRNRRGGKGGHDVLF